MSTENYIYGRNAVMEFLDSRPEHVTKLYIKQQMQGRTARELEQLASAGRVPVQRVPGKKLFELVGAVNDQGVVAAISEAGYVELDDWLASVEPGTNPVLLALDEIDDPHNFGAIIRSAAAAGAAGVMVPKHRQAPLTGAVMKASAGAVLRLPVIRVGNTNQALEKLKDAGFWVCGTAMDAPATLWEQRYDMPLVVMIGSEDKGIRKKTREHCDMLVRIPMASGIESLNASVSASLLCYEILRQRQPKPE
ncbi:23S rRNA (guanosine(2251)-2'-O)-methyltransferase RlmB [Balneolales bacterium ANBcel1]|nr:23S rRNA (guanosine(2251)-2'-O)-methyltransferase RlmB [Balneolales bacterium ANBcel1]